MTKLITAYIKRNNLDKFGVMTSMLCAIHCSVLPIISSLLPLSGLSFFEKPEVEFGFIGMSLLIALYSLVPSYLKVHKSKTPSLIVLFGFGLIAFGHLAGMEAFEAYTSTIGALSIAFAHILNISLLKRA
jgi:hypothetical protein